MISVISVLRLTGVFGVTVLPYKDNNRACMNHATPSSVVGACPEPAREMEESLHVSELDVCDSRPINALDY